MAESAGTYKNSFYRNKICKNGFTLLELSIVLVIIAIVIGGILLGSEMIKTSEIRATISQYERYKTATHTFRSKYDALPGDIPTTDAAAFGFFAQTTLGGTDGYGDGDGLLEDGQGTLEAASENLMFWRHLGEAGLINGAYGIQGDNAIDPTTGNVTADTTNVALSLPPAKIGRGNYFNVYSRGTSNLNANFYEIHAVTSITSVGTTTASTSKSITPSEAYSIDSKIDDGLPNVGNAVARGASSALLPFDATPASWVAVNTADTCMASGALATDSNVTYNLSAGQGVNDPSCALRLTF